MAAWKGLLFAAVFVFIAFAIIESEPVRQQSRYHFRRELFSDERALRHRTHDASGVGFSRLPARITAGRKHTSIRQSWCRSLAPYWRCRTFRSWRRRYGSPSNTGELLYILRLVSGVGALATLLFFFFYFKKRKIRGPLALSLVLFLFLLLSNVLVIEFLHTAKVWVFYIIMVAAMSAVFIANEYYLSRLNTPFMRTERYTALLVWSGVLVFSKAMSACSR